MTTPAPRAALGRSKAASVGLLAVAQVLAMSLWFVSAAILPELTAEAGLGTARAAALSSAVQIGFVLGALALAIHGTADRHDPRRVLALSALIAAAANLALLVTPPGGAAQVALRLVTGAALAGVYPVGMKIAVGWGTRDRGLLVGLLVGALTVGSALPHLLAFTGGPDWRATVALASALAAAGGLLILAIGLGPHHARAAAFDPGALRLAWTDRRIRLAFAGYLGHMWELYAFWAWIAAAATVALVLVWGAAVIPDSAQFSALVADAAPPDRAGSLMTFQTALAFMLTFSRCRRRPRWRRSSAGRRRSA